MTTSSCGCTYSLATTAVKCQRGCLPYCLPYSDAFLGGILCHNHMSDGVHYWLIPFLNLNKERLTSTSHQSRRQSQRIPNPNQAQVAWKSGLLLRSLVQINMMDIYTCTHISCMKFIHVHIYHVYIICIYICNIYQDPPTVVY